MKYKSINELNTFEFHDALIKDISFNHNEIIILVSELNATTDNSQNTDTVDLCIEEAELTFLNAKITKIEFSGWVTYDSHHNLIEKVEPRQVDNADFFEIVQKTKECGWAYFQSMESVQKQDDKFTVCFYIDGGAGTYYMTMEYSCASVTWNSYSGAAWYEMPPFKKI